MVYAMNWYVYQPDKKLVHKVNGCENSHPWRERQKPWLRRCYDLTTAIVSGIYAARAVQLATGMATNISRIPA